MLKEFKNVCLSDNVPVGRQMKTITERALERIRRIRAILLTVWGGSTARLVEKRRDEARGGGGGGVKWDASSKVRSKVILGRLKQKGKC